MILVTGGSGFIGSQLIGKLSAEGVSVRCLRHRRSVPSGPRLEVVPGDIVSGAGLADALRGVDTVIHLAGLTKALTVAEFEVGNVRGTENLARAAAGRSIRFVHVSTLAAIGPSLDGTPVTEEAEPHPLTHYGRSKLAGERVVRALLPDAVIVRPPVVYGPRDTGVFQMLRSVQRGIVLEITGGERWFSAIYVADLAEGLIAAARSPSAPGREYFLAHPTPVTWRELGSVPARIMGRKPRVLRVPVFAAYGVGYCAEWWSRVTRTPGIVSREKVTEAMCRYWTCDTRRAAREIGFQASTSFEQGIAQALAWYREAGWLHY